MQTSYTLGPVHEYMMSMFNQVSFQTHPIWIEYVWDYVLLKRILIEMTEDFKCVVQYYLFKKITEYTTSGVGQGPKLIFALETDSSFVWLCHLLLSIKMCLCWSIAQFLTLQMHPDWVYVLWKLSL